MNIMNIMNIHEAKKLGYKIKYASSFEIGLVKKGKGIRTWWAKDFDDKIPSLDHPKIQKAIEINEQIELNPREFFNKSTNDGD